MLKMLTKYLIFLSLSSFAFQGEINTIAGPVKGPLSASLKTVGGIAIDSHNQIITTSSSDGFLLKGDTTNTYSIILSKLHNPKKPVIDSKGNIYYINDWSADAISVVDTNGKQKNYLEKSDEDFYRASDLYISPQDEMFILYEDWKIAKIEKLDQPKAKLYLNCRHLGLGQPLSVVMDHQGNLYIATDSHRIYKFAPDKSYQLFAGIGITGYYGDGGPATKAKFRYPNAIDLDNEGNLIVSDSRNFVIRKIDTSGIITTIAGTGVEGKKGTNGLAVNAQFWHIVDLEVDLKGNIHIADGTTIRTIGKDGILRLSAGSPYSFDGNDEGKDALQGYFLEITDLLIDDDGSIYICDYKSNRIQKIDPDGTIRTIAGTGEHKDSGDGGLAIHASFVGPLAIAKDSVGNLYVGSYYFIRKIDTNGVITRVAGAGEIGDSIDGGPALEAQLDRVTDIVIDKKGNLFFSDRTLRNRKIKKIDASGMITTIAEGKQISDGLCLSEDDVLYFTKIFSQIGKVDTNGRSSFINHKFSFFATHIKMDKWGWLYLSPFTTTTIVKMHPEKGLLDTIVGTGEDSYTGDGGPALEATITGQDSPIAFDREGNLFIAQTYRGFSFIRKVERVVPSERPSRIHHVMKPKREPKNWRRFYNLIGQYKPSANTR